MLKKILKKIESKRGTKNCLFNILVKTKDFTWRIKEKSQRVFRYFMHFGVLGYLVDKICIAKALSSKKPIKLNLGCGQDYMEGYLNIELNADYKADLIMDIKNLRLFPDNSVDIIESYHVFEHLMLCEAKQALREWFRVLKVGGKIVIELPNFEAYVKEIGKYFKDDYDLAMGGIYGQWPTLAHEGVFQVHKWGWTPKTLSMELHKAGFQNIHLEPTKQTWRITHSFGVDMRLVASKENLT
jgi:SAM-dependent methyltransferase